MAHADACPAEPHRVYLGTGTHLTIADSGEHVVELVNHGPGQLNPGFLPGRRNLDGVCRER